MYPLYYTLNKNLLTTDLKKNEKEELISAISTMDSEYKNAIYLLIYEHFRSDSKEGIKTPYESKMINENSIEFDLAKMPIKLRRILFNFAKIRN